jgi:hypothetical protein
MRHRLLTSAIASAIAIGATMILAAPVAHACGFLVAPNGAVQLVRTSTFVAWEDGVERYITSFEFASTQPSFGSIVPLPARPIDVERAGDWTLQRLQQEVADVVDTDATAAPAEATDAGRAVVILEKRIDSLDITVLQGGGADVLAWAVSNGFDLPTGPETANLLDFYGDRSPYFLAARFDADRAAADAFQSGDGMPIQITMRTPQPWVPLHILGFAKAGVENVEADVFLLTPDEPDLLHGPGLDVVRSEPASDLLLDDLRSDEGMSWVPGEGWFSYLRVEAAAQDLVYDLSVGTAGTRPSYVATGLTRFEPDAAQLRGFGLEPVDRPWWHAWWPVALAGMAFATVAGGTAGLVVTRREALKAAARP